MKLIPAKLGLKVFGPGSAGGPAPWPARGVAAVGAGGAVWEPVACPAITVGPCGPSWMRYCTTVVWEGQQRGSSAL